MELVCEKYNQKMAAENAVCRHPQEYCKFRTSCMIHFIGGKDMSGPPDEDSQDEAKMIMLRFDKGNGLLPAIAQDYKTGEVLMMAYINEQAWAQTLATGKAHYWSRSRNKLWLKGESSKHYQVIKDILVDCDEDTVIYKVEQIGGAACHTGYRTCFYRRVQDAALKVEGERIFDPEEVYSK
jgi:phosphoribosyl-AMP cyclohydrolase